MNPWNIIICELACHLIHVQQDDTVTISNVHGRKTMTIDEAIKYINNNCKKNVETLLSLWREASSFRVADTLHPSNDVTRRLFVAAIKRMASEANACSLLRDNSIDQEMNHMLVNDINQFSQHDMQKFIGYNLAAGWLQHLVSYDYYRLCLLELIKGRTASLQLGAKVERASIKTAANVFNNLDTPILGERAVPWNLIADSITEHSQNKSNASWLQNSNEQDRPSLPNAHPMSGVYLIPDFHSGLDALELYSNRYKDGHGDSPPLNNLYRE